MARCKVRRRSQFDEYAKVWDFWRDGVTQSLLSTFFQCPELCRLKYVEGLTSYKVSEAIEFGNVFHYVLSELYALNSGTKPRLDEVMSWVRDYADEWRHDHPKCPQSQLDTMEKVYTLAEAMLCAYVDRWAGDWSGKYKHGNDTVAPVEWLATERRFRIPYTFDDGACTWLNGMFDGVFEDENGDLWLFETKTKSRIDENALSDCLPLDRQVMLYLHALRVVYGGRRVRGVLYNVIRRPSNRLRADEALHTFGERVGKEVAKKLGTGYYYIRWQVDVSNAESIEWATNQLRAEMQTIRAWWSGDIPHRMNPDALETKYGRSDMYGPIVFGDRNGHFVRDKAFAELPDVEGN